MRVQVWISSTHLKFGQGANGDMRTLGDQRPPSVAKTMSSRFSERHYLLKKEKRNEVDGQGEWQEVISVNLWPKYRRPEELAGLGM